MYLGSSSLGTDGASVFGVSFEVLVDLGFSGAKVLDVLLGSDA